MPTPEFPARLAAVPALLTEWLASSQLVALALAAGDRLCFANAAFRALFGRGDELIDAAPETLVLAEYRSAVRLVLQATDSSPRLCVARAMRGSLSSFEVELQIEPLQHDGQQLVAIFAQDVTERFRAEAQLSLLAYSDPLTGLANRAMFADRLRQAALAVRRSGHGFAVLMLDLDGFKLINDAHGHEIGDRVLQRVAARLLDGVRETDTVARYGGDEFAVLLPSIRVPPDVEVVADRLMTLTRQPIELGDFVVQVGMSSGMALYPEHAGNIDHLLAAADTAMYAAKRRGRGSAVWATGIASAADHLPLPLLWSESHVLGVPEMDEQHAHLARLLNALARTLRNGEESGTIFGEIVRYTREHFAREEVLMRRCGYVGTAAHAEMHRLLLEELCSLRLDGDSLSVSLTLRFLQEWLLRHVDGADRHAAEAIRAAIEERTEADATR